MNRSLPADWPRVFLRDVTFECLAREGSSSKGRRVFGVSKGCGLVPMKERVQGAVLDRYKVVKPGTFAYNPMRLNIGSIAHSALEEEVLVSPDYVVFECDRRFLDHRFLDHVRRSRAWEDFVGGSGSGSVRTRIYFRDLAEFSFHLPPLPEQRRIAEVLTSVDDAIAATEAVIAQTKRLKQGLLEHLLTRGLGHTRFKKTEIGEIPVGWDVVKLSCLLAEPVRNGYSPVSPDTDTGKVVLTLGAVSSEGLDPTAVKPAPADSPQVDRCLLRPGDFLVSRSNTRDRVGFSAVFRGEIQNCSYPDLLMRFRVAEDRVNLEFLEEYLRSRQALGFLQSKAAGTSGSMVKITKAALEQLPVPRPSLPEQARIADALRSAGREQVQSREQLQSLLSLKSGLLSDLLSGRVRVPESL